MKISYYHHLSSLLISCLSLILTVPASAASETVIFRHSGDSCRPINLSENLNISHMGTTAPGCTFQVTTRATGEWNLTGSYVDTPPYAWGGDDFYDIVQNEASKKLHPYSYSCSQPVYSITSASLPGYVQQVGAALDISGSGTSVAQGKLYTFTVSASAPVGSTFDIPLRFDATCSMIADGEISETIVDIAYANDNTPRCRDSIVVPKNARYATRSYSLLVDSAQTCAILPTAMPTPTSSPTPSPTPTPTVTPTITPTPVSWSSVLVSGRLFQKTGGILRKAGEDLSRATDGTASSFRISNTVATPLVLTGSGCTTVNPLIMYSSSPDRAATFSLTYAPPSGCVPLAQTVRTIPALETNRYTYEPISGETNFTITGEMTSYRLPTPFSPSLISSGANTGTADVVLNYIGPGWIKLKDASFTHPGSTPYPVTIPVIIDKFLPGTSDQSRVGTGDATDSTNRYFIDGKAGIVTNTDPQMDMIGSGTGWGRRSSTQWYTDAYPQALATQALTTLVDRVIASQTSVSTSAPSTLPAGSITIVNSTSVTLGDLQIIGTSPKPTVLLVRNGSNLGQVRLSGQQYNTSSQPLMLIADTVTIDENTNVIFNGIIITNHFRSGSVGTLRIHGNLNTLVDGDMQRSRADGDHARPSVFIDFAPEMYTPMLPLFTGAARHWEQIE